MVEFVGHHNGGNVFYATDNYLYGKLSPHFAELLAVKEGVRIAIKFQSSN